MLMSLSNIIACIYRIRHWWPKFLIYVMDVHTYPNLEAPHSYVIEQNLTKQLWVNYSSILCCFCTDRSNRCYCSNSHHWISTKVIMLIYLAVISCAREGHDKKCLHNHIMQLHGCHFHNFTGHCQKADLQF